MKAIGIIPARYASTRFPGKPLVDIGGKSMVMRVYERAKSVEEFDRVVVATDDERIYEHVLSQGGEAEMTSTEHQSGTDRCAEVLSRYSSFDVVINIQGDEPFVNPIQIKTLISCFDKSNTELATLVKRIHSYDDLCNYNTPKVVLNKEGEALYFSRATIPHKRGVEQSEWLREGVYYKHIGIYGYRRDVLMKITQLPQSYLEKMESLEQLRWIENGFKIQTAETDFETIAIDSPEDLNKLSDFLAL